MLMAVVMEAFDGCFLDCPVHPFNLTIGPWMIGFFQTVFDPMSFTDHVEVRGTRPGRLAAKDLFSELDPIVGQNGTDPVRNDAQKIVRGIPRPSSDRLSRPVV